MNEYRLMVVDLDNEYAKQTADFLAAHAGFKVVGTAADGIEALKVLKRTKPDVVLLDLLLPGMDGLSLMRTIQAMKPAPVVICLSEAYTSVSIELARRNGACYYMYKPVEPESLAAVMKDCCRLAFEKRNLDVVREGISHSGELTGRIHSLLHELGFSFKFNGSEYLAKSVELAMESPMALHNISSGVYEKIAAQMKVSSASVERNMRTAIAFADTEGRLTEKIGASPTNKVCIRYLLHAIQVQN